MTVKKTMSWNGTNPSKVTSVVSKSIPLLPLDEAVASRALFVIIMSGTGSDGQTDGRTKTLLDPDK